MQEEMRLRESDQPGVREELSKVTIVTTCQEGNQDKSGEETDTRKETHTYRRSTERSEDGGDWINRSRKGTESPRGKRQKFDRSSDRDSLSSARSYQSWVRGSSSASMAETKKHKDRR